ncbi:hypothetical protein HELRODRAFT_162993 [Helobdella robusta]|uniref:Uncharacterized protein n=1 Tax=Helobdella robusta TaxID=6412 RepID=T1ETI5_HELRO|nr:hypothetical protein HELRODRAFT_162993 [Helobdella robusta]ESN99444.1 hypothetical protein HELRODRAFT_162993 [Helobdella robusta]
MATSMFSTGYGPRSRRVFNGDERKYKLWEVKFMGSMRLQKLHDVFMSTDDPEEEQNAEIFAELIQCLDDRKIVTDYHYMLPAGTIASSLKTAGEVINDSLHIAMILKGLPQEFKTFCTVTTRDAPDLGFSLGRI